jgi:hypothetical protein
MSAFSFLQFFSFFKQSHFFVARSAVSLPASAEPVNNFTNEYDQQ